MSTGSSFYHFCGGSSFWNESFYKKSDWPQMTPCFMNTVVVWIPCGWLWLSLPLHLHFLYTREIKTTKIPLNLLSVSKLVVTLFLCLLNMLYLIQDLAQTSNVKEDEKNPIKILNYSLYIVSFLLAGILTQIERVKGRVTSLIQFVFWLLLVFSNILPFYSKIFLKIYHDNLFDFVTFYIFYFFLILQFVLQCWAEKAPLSLTDGEKTMCPEIHASIMNRIYFWWMNSIVIQAYKKPLKENDVWSLGIANKSETIVPQFEKHWKKEVSIKQKKLKTRKKDFFNKNGKSVTNEGLHNEKTPLLFSFPSVSPDVPEKKENCYKADEIYKPKCQTKISISFVLAKTFGLEYLLSLVIKVLADVIQFASPILLGLLMNYADAKSELPLWRGYIPAILLFVCAIFQSVLNHQGYQIGMTIGMRIKSTLIAAIFKKSLTLRPSEKKSTTLGEIVNLMSVDCQRIQDCFTYAWSLMTCPVQMAIGIILLWEELGPSCLAGLAVFILMATLSSVIVTRQKILQDKVLFWKGKRIKLINEILNGIKVLKMYAWEPYFEEKIKEIRNKELHFLTLNACLQGGTTFFWILAPYLVTLATFSVYVLTSEDHFIDARKAFVAVAVFNILGFPVNFLALTISFMAQAYVSIKRIQRFLACADLDPDNVQRNSNSEYPIKAENGVFTWDSSTPSVTLRNINLKVSQGQLIAIVGQVGCGKSSLISALLGEMDKLKGNVNISGSVAYVPQEAWIQNATLKDNILFGKDILQKKYNRVVEACALTQDLEILPGGDMIEIGEKGINISGGQKQRVSLARAVYSNSDIYLMDDPLSAVDAHVGKHIFEKVIGSNGLLKRKTRILVTHGVHWLPMVDNIVVMVNGKFSETGSYDELVSHNGAFAQFLKQYLQQEEESNIADPPDIHNIKQKIMEHVEYVTSEGLTTTDVEGETPGISLRERETPILTKTSTNTLRQDIHGFEGIERLTTEELPEQGKIKLSVFGEYAKALGVPACILIVTFFLSFNAANMFANFWLTFWTEDDFLKSNGNLSSTQVYMEKSYRYLTIYGILGIIQAFFVFIYAILLSIRTVVASGKLHNRMLQGVMKAPMAFFDTTPIGRITNRFSSDVDIMDTTLPLTIRISYQSLMFTLSTLIVISMNTPWTLTVTISVGVLYYFLLKFYIPTVWQLKRLEAVTRSPVYNYFSETVTGASVIRAFNVTDRFVTESMKRVDKHLVYYYANFSSARWLGVRIEILGNLLVFAAALFSIFSDLDGGTVGLSVTYALQMTYILNGLVVSFSELANNIVCVERVKDYSEVKREADWYTRTRSPQHWPSTGHIQFVEYKTRYREGLDLVLKGINLEINHGEMIGIVGRTGAGKSSLTLSLFRLIEASGGNIIIDGVNIADIGLHDLRSKITILPQDPVLFSGSLRMNLDPFHQYSDDKIWQALESAHLKEFALTVPSQLEYQCGEGGSNLSVGQRQLVCLGRTLLKKTKILILDEATAAVDFQTDDLIQETIRTEFRDCTVLTIAHRLNTILDYDKVMVLDDGQIVEFDTPGNLLDDKSSVFSRMTQDAYLTKSQTNEKLV